MLTRLDLKRRTILVRAIGFSILLGAFVLPALRAESGEMNRSDIDDVVARLFAVDKGAEPQAAMDLVSRLADAGMKAEARLVAVDRSGRLTFADHSVNPERVVVILIADEVYVWRPKDDSSVAAFFLE